VIDVLVRATSQMLVHAPDREWIRSGQEEPAGRRKKVCRCIKQPADVAQVFGDLARHNHVEGTVRSTTRSDVDALDVVALLTELTDGFVEYIDAQAPRSDFGELTVEPTIGPIRDQRVVHDADVKQSPSSDGIAQERGAIGDGGPARSVDR